VPARLTPESHPGAGKPESIDFRIENLTQKREEDESTRITEFRHDTIAEHSASR
jgi:hypothetical protein